MIPVSRDEFDRLSKAKLIDYNKVDRNFRIVNKNKSGKRKKYYVVETKKILNFLGRNK